MAEQPQYQHRMPNQLINVLHLEPGMQVRLIGQAIAVVVDNPQDGVWLLVRYVSCPANPALVGSEEMVFAEDVLDIVGA